MSKEFYSQHLYNCEVDDIDIYFEYNNSVVFSTRKSTKDDFLKWKVAFKGWGCYLLKFDSFVKWYVFTGNSKVANLQLKMGYFAWGENHNERIYFRGTNWRCY